MSIIILIIIGFIVFCFYMAQRTNKCTNEQIEEQNTINNDHDYEDYRDVQISFHISEENSPEEEPSSVIRETPDGWVINSGMPFELTILNCNMELAKKIRDLCEEGYYKAEKEMLVLFATNNIKVKEIEDYKTKYRKIFFDRYEQLKRESSEYQDADTQDRADMEEEFFKQAQDSLYELASYDAYKLFRSYDMTIDDEFLQEYGFDILNTYFTYANKIGKVVVISKDNYHRAAFEKMAEIGLALRGKDIPMEELLTSQTLKKLNEIADNPEKEFKRKNQAIDYIIEHPEKHVRIGDYISFRELFKLLPLPERYANLDLGEVCMMWGCHREEVRILLLTYSQSQYAARELKSAREIYEGAPYHFRVSVGNEQCRRAKDMARQTYPKNRPPRVPCHVGCNCWMRATTHE